LHLTTASAACAARYEVTAHGKTERQFNFHSMLPTEAKNQQEQIRKLTPQNFPKATNAVLVLEAQRKVEGRRAFAASLSNGGLG
jgi:hypothetical protein